MHGGRGVGGRGGAGVEGITVYHVVWTEGVLKNGFLLTDWEVDILGSGRNSCGKAHIDGTVTAGTLLLGSVGAGHGIVMMRGI